VADVSSGTQEQETNAYASGAGLLRGAEAALTLLVHLGAGSNT
jgi:hypothetical protein